MTETPGPDDVRAAARLCRETLSVATDADWSVPADQLEWDCGFTVVHIADALGFYAAHLAARAPAWLKFDVVPHDDATNVHRLRLVEAMGEVLAVVLEAAPDDAVGFHHSGMRAPDEVAAMGCLETVVHTSDVARGLGIDFDPPADLCLSIVQRLFVDAPADEPWRVLLWATGRGSLPDRDDLGAGWLTHWWPSMATARSDDRS